MPLSVSAAAQTFSSVTPSHLCRETLSFKLSEDGETLSIILHEEVEKAGRNLSTGERKLYAQNIPEEWHFCKEPEDVPNQSKVWEIRKAAFGPQAKFELFHRGSGQISLRISDISYGYLEGRYVEYQFRYGSEKSDADLHGPIHPLHAQKAVALSSIIRWKIGIETDVWNSEEGQNDPFFLESEETYGNEKQSYITLREYLEDVGLVQTINSKRINSTFQDIFNGAVEASGESTEPIALIGLTKDGVWQLFGDFRKKRALEFSSISGAVSASCFRFSWCESCLQEFTPLPKPEGKKKQDDENQKFTAEVVITADNDDPALLGILSAEAYSKAGNKTAEPPNLNLLAVGKDEKATFSPSRSSRDNPEFLIQSNVRQGSATSGTITIINEVVAAVSHSWALEFIRADTSQAGPFEAIHGILKQVITIGKSTGGRKDPTTSVITFQGALDSLAPQTIDTRAGKLELTGVPFGEPTVKNRRDLTTVFANPLANVAGVPVSVASAQFSVTSGPLSAAGLAHFEVNVLLRRCDAAVSGADFSRIDLQDTDLTLLWDSKEITAAPRSFIWLGSELKYTADWGRIDLSRARVTVANASQLLALKFGFRDLFLGFTNSEKGGGDTKEQGRGLRVSPYSEICSIRAHGLPDPDLGTGSGQLMELRRIELENRAEKQAEVVEVEEQDELPVPEISDNRPLLVVEFPPQHILEEAFFIPQMPPPPDVDGIDNSEVVQLPTDEDGAERNMVRVNDLTAISNALKALSKRDQRRTFRTDIANNKEEKEENFARTRDMPEKKAPRPFAEFRKKFEKHAKRLGAPVDQQIYIGSVGMDPDMAALARSLQEENRQRIIGGLVSSMFAEVKQELKRIKEQAERRVSDADQRISKFFEPGLTKGRFLNQIDVALEIEAMLESSIPAYQLYRTFYRDTMIGVVTGSVKPANNETLNPDGLGAADVEFFSSLALDAITGFPDHPKRMNAITARYKGAAQGSETLKETVEGRLSGPSRLAFRINCNSAVSDSQDRYNRDEPRLDQPASFDFSVRGLTNWSKMELSVVRRAQTVFAPAPGGRLDANSERTVNLNAGAMLDHLGFKAGKFVTANDRLADIATSLRKSPGEFETAIELPARLILSPSQQANFITPHSVPRDVYNESRQPDPIVVDSEKVTRSALWSAELHLDGQEPGIRAVHSPDLADSFLWHRIAGLEKPKLNGKRLPGSGAPPRGPYAPWLLGREQTSATTPSASSLANEKPLELDIPRDVEADARTEEALCNFVLDEQASSDAGRQDETGKLRYGVPKLIEYLCGRTDQKHPLASDITFRASLDAFDRHELVLLTSAYGLPVVGRRDVQNRLTANSGQYEPDRDHQLVDVRPGSAIYQPKPLNMRQLSLSSLGGTLRHDTSFEPPASAKHIIGGKLFDALSIERWQQWTAIGRDIFTEIVYKGFLFPMGHRASLVKVTERTFMKSPKGYVRAYLRQRMFIRCAKPNKTFPAVAQPNNGRQFPARSFNILTQTTPDIVDPSSIPATGPVAANGEVQANGRLRFNDKSGLVFWPRTANLAGTEVRFEAMIDNAFCEMPLLFLDNVAANDAETVEAVVAYYNNEPGREGIPSPDRGERDTVVDHTKHMRTIALAGEKMRYCAEKTTGEASIETDFWTLRAQGRQRLNREDRDTKLNRHFRFNNTNYDFDPLLQGADQPPFYPAVESARIRLKQNELLTGKKADPLRAMLDATYIDRGFKYDRQLKADPATRDLVRVEDNPMELYLVLRDGADQKMGRNGDQSGGIAQPNGTIVALSRTRGLMTGQVTTFAPDAGIDALPTLAHTFDSHPNITELKRIEAVKKPAGRITRSSSATVEVRPIPDAAEKDNADDENQERKAADEVWEKVVGDAKLFNLVKLADLIKYASNVLSDPSTGAPQMVEQVRYAAGNLEKQGIKAANDITAFLKQNVLRPLREVVLLLKGAWADLDTEIRKRQRKTSKVVAELTVEDIFPEINDAILALEQAIDASLAQTDTVSFSLSLGFVFESGKGFFNAAEQAVANAGDRFEAALSERYNAIVQTGEELLNAAETFGRDFADRAVDELITALIDLVFPNGKGLSAFAVRLHLPLPNFQGIIPAELAELQAVKAFDARTDIKAELVFTEGELKSVVTYMLKEAVGGRSIDDAWNLSATDNAPDWFDEGASPKVALSLKIMTFIEEGKEGTEEYIEGIEKLARDLESEGRNQASEMQERIKAKVIELKTFGDTTVNALKLIIVETVDGVTAEVWNRLNSELQELEDEAKEAARREAGRLARRLLASNNSLVALIEQGQSLHESIGKEKYREALTSLIAIVEIFIGDLGIDADALGSKPVEKIKGLLTTARDAVSAINPELCLKLPNKVRYDVETMTIVTGDNNAYDPADRTTFCALVYEGVKQTKSLHDGFGKLKLDSVPEKLEDITAIRDKIADLQSQKTDTLSNIRAINTTLGLLFINLTKDSQAAKKIDTDLSDLIKDLDLDGETFNRVEQLPDKLEEFFLLRRDLLETNLKALETLGGQVETLLKSELFIAVSLGSGFEDYLKSHLGATPHQVLELFEDKINTFEELGLGLVWAILVQIEATLAFAHSGSGTLINQAQELQEQFDSLGLLIKLSGLEANITALGSYRSYVGNILNKLKQLHEGDGDDSSIRRKLTKKDIEGLTAEFEGKQLPLLDFVRITPGVNNAKLSALKERLDAFIASITDVKKLLPQARDAALGEVYSRLDSTVSTLFAKEDGINLLVLYAKMQKGRESIVSEAKQSILLDQLAGVLLIKPDEARKPLAADGGVTYSPPENPQTKLSVTNDQLAGDVAWLTKAFSGGDQAKPLSDLKNRAFLRHFFEEWGDGNATPLLIVKEIEEVLISLLQGDLLELFDIEKFRAMIEEYLLSLVPAQRRYKRGFNLPLPKEVRAATGGIFVPRENCELTLNGEVVIDFIDPENQTLDGIGLPKVAFAASGELGAFDIKLVGGFDALTLKFSGARFETNNDSKPKFSIQYDDYEIGKELEFVQDLQKFLSPKEGSGAYINPLTGGTIGIEAGYSLSLGAISIGTISFFNVSLNTAAVLPFDQSPARFRASLSRRRSPFTISYAPFGGSGFLAIEADADGIVGFEASFEFGGAAAFAVGPLTGTGRIMAGFYIRQMRLADDRKVTELSATFFAGGAANIWIFNFGASLYVRLGQSDGNMSGEAIFTFSFSMGLADFDFTIRFAKEEKKGFEGGSASLNRETEFAGRLHPYNVASTGKIINGRARKPAKRLYSTATCMGEDWSRHMEYFDDTSPSFGVY